MIGHRSSGYVGLLFATFLALVRPHLPGMTMAGVGDVEWSFCDSARVGGASVSVAWSVDDHPPRRCECNPQFHLISHRGGASMAPENTMAAFRMARQVRTQWKELLISGADISRPLNGPGDDAG